MNALGVNIAESGKPFATGSIRVLVVDDDQNTRDYLCELLIESGCDATAVATGDEAIQRYRCERYSIVILDIFMPGKNGFDTIMEIRRSFPEARVIAISGRVEHQGVDVVNWAKKIGAQRVLHKPFTPDELLYAMAELLQQAGEIPLNLEGDPDDRDRLNPLTDSCTECQGVITTLRNYLPPPEELSNRQALCAI